MKIKDSIVWVTGGTSGIGEGIAEYLVERGAKVMISGRNEVKGQEIVKRLGENCVFKKCDITSMEEIQDTAKAIVDRWGRLDVLCNFAGMPTPYMLFDENGELNPNDAFRKDINVNLIASYDVARVAAYYMKNNEPGDHGERGCIVLCSSLAAGSANGVLISGYKTAKEGVRALTRVFATCLAPYAIRCNSIMPGWVLSGMTTNPATNLGIDPSKDMKNQVFPKEIGDPLHIAMMVGQLIENVYMNRTDINVDAGDMARY